MQPVFAKVRRITPLCVTRLCVAVNLVVAYNGRYSCYCQRTGSNRVRDARFIIGQDRCVALPLREDRPAQGICH